MTAVLLYVLTKISYNVHTRLIFQCNNTNFQLISSDSSKYSDIIRIIIIYVVRYAIPAQFLLITDVQFRYECPASRYGRLKPGEKTPILID
jgi:hypothetical protein